MIPNWGVFYQPLGAVLLFAAMFAEANRLPFDLPEAEGELVAGYHTEYAGFKFNMFFIGEYGHMFVASALMVIFFFGGYTLPGLNADTVPAMLSNHLSWSPTWISLLSAVLLHLVFMAKVVLFLWIFIHVRWTLPRFRYDQLMDLGWRTMLPWALFNTVATAAVILVMRTAWGS
jgi:NADH-quinone oxidoreductase subunit H